VPSSGRDKLNELVGNQQIVQALWDAVNTSAGSLGTVAPLVKRLLQTGAWKQREVRQLGEIVRFDSFPAFIQAAPLRGCGWPLEKVEALIKDDPDTLKMWRQATTASQGRPLEKSDNVTVYPRRGNSRAYTLDRLSRERPDLYQRVIAKELTANAAAAEAGWRGKATALDDLQRAWKRATPEERAAFLAEVRR